MVEGHYRKIKMLKGVPGVRADRFSEAFRIRHCALSLGGHPAPAMGFFWADMSAVGEPIFYPYINEFLALLHGSGISSFLVCNAQQYVIVPSLVLRGDELCELRRGGTARHSCEHWGL